jgi:hypothetical protein
MSIAVAAKLRPSHICKFIISGMIFVILVAGFYSSVLLWQSGSGMYAVLPIAAILIAATLLLSSLKSQSTCQIDIYNSGDIVLRQSDCSHSCFLGEHTRLWTAFLLLHLQDEQKRSWKILIFADSLDGRSFRALSVALNWVMKHGSDHELFMHGGELL